jgi:hypothetical protein
VEQAARVREVIRVGEGSALKILLSRQNGYFKPTSKADPCLYDLTQTRPAVGWRCVLLIDSER